MSVVKQPPEAIQKDTPAAAVLRQKWERLNVENEHWMCCIVGEEGKGKSYTAIKIGELIDPNFSADNVFFHPADLLEALKDEDYQAGDVWVLDEAGVGMGNRTWQDSGQVKLNQALQLVRSHNVGFIFTLPRLDELDKQARGRLQSAIEIVKKVDGEYVQGPWWESNVERMGFSSSGLWWDKPVVKGSEVGAVSFTPPSDEIIEPYEATKQEFQEEFYEETIDELRGDSEADEDDDDPSPKGIADEIVENGVDDYIDTINNGTQDVLDADLIAADYELSKAKARQVKKLVKRAAGLEGVL